jgi:hypothetical protein
MRTPKILKKNVFSLINYCKWAQNYIPKHLSDGSNLIQRQIGKIFEVFYSSFSKINRFYNTHLSKGLFDGRHLINITLRIAPKSDYWPRLR